MKPATILSLWAIAAFGVLGAVGPASADDQSFSLIDKGREMAQAGDCAACHTNSQSKPFAGGKALETPFGTLLSSNITPDTATGIGAWTDDEFVDAVKRGIGRNGRHLYPAMPYPNYTKMSREDVLAIRAYLNTLQPVANKVRTNRLPFPFNVRAVMAIWNGLFFSSGDFKPSPDKSADWNRGAYLVEGAGHCGSCHTEKNFMGADKTSRALQGGELQGWFAPNLTGDPREGLGAWSVDEIVAYLKTGRNTTSASTGPMAEVITDSTSYLPDADLKAIAVYLRDQKDNASVPQALAASDPQMHAGKEIYGDACAACHAGAGTGIPHLFSMLRGSSSVQASNPINLIRILLEGTRSVATDAAPVAAAMPAQGWRMSDDQVAAVLTYVRNAWGNAASAVNASQVKSVRKELAKSKGE